MRINGQSIEKFGARLLTFELQPAQDEVAVDWVAKGLTPIKGDTTVTFGTAKAVLYFRGTDPGRIVQSVAEVLALLEKEAVLTVPGYRGQYVAFKTTSNIEKVQRSKTRRKLTLNFKGYLRGDKQVRKYQGAAEAKLNRVGARPTPVILTITPTSDMDSFTIGGLTDDPITITNLSAGIPVTIDGRDATAWERGVSKATDVDMWEPPALRKQTAVLTFSSAAPTVTVEYWPIWL